MKGVKTIARIVLAVSMAAAVGLELHAARMSILLVPFTLWVASPFGLMLWGTRSPRLRPVSCWILLGGSILLALVSVAAYRPAEIASRSTAALNFVFIPLWQNIAAAAGAVSRMHDRRPGRCGRVPTSQLSACSSGSSGTSARDRFAWHFERWNGHEPVP